MAESGSLRGPASQTSMDTGPSRRFPNGGASRFLPGHSRRRRRNVGQRGGGRGRPFVRRPPRESRSVSAVGERKPVVRGATGSTRGRAFSGLALVFALSFVNLVGILVTATALGGIAPWTRWQFIGMFGVVELAASALLLPHWGGLARAGAGLAFVVLAAWQEGVAPVSLLLVPLVLALAWFVLAVSAALARAGVARPDVDVVQFVVRWGRRERELTPISVGASVF